MLKLLRRLFPKGRYNSAAARDATREKKLPNREIKYLQWALDAEERLRKAFDCKVKIISEYIESKYRLDDYIPGKYTDFTIIVTSNNIFYGYPDERPHKKRELKFTRKMFHILRDYSADELFDLLIPVYDEDD